jgi:hypothetical protein
VVLKPSLSSRSPRLSSRALVAADNSSGVVRFSAAMRSHRRHPNGDAPRVADHGRPALVRRAYLPPVVGRPKGSGQGT